MPQEIALFMEFTLFELLYYFGTIFKMRKAKILEKYNFLINFLDLPKDNRYLGSFRWAYLWIYHALEIVQFMEISIFIINF